VDIYLDMFWIRFGCGLDMEISQIGDGMDINLCTMIDRKCWNDLNFTAKMAKIGQF
jgi:hypothetical protein